VLESSAQRLSPARVGLTDEDSAHAPDTPGGAQPLTLEKIRENPRQLRDSYGERADQWTTTYGGGAGLIVYAVHEHQRVISLWLV
jgi:hypothetical protein